MSRPQSRSEWDETPNRKQWDAAFKAGFRVCVTTHPYDEDDPGYDGIRVFDHMCGGELWSMYRIDEAEEGDDDEE